MKNRLMTLAALALTFASCATTTVREVQPLTLTASAVTIPGGGNYPAYTLVTAAYLDGDEMLQFPRVMVLEGAPASAFVGEVGPDGERDGFQLDLLVEGDTATLEASELKAGKVLRHEVQTIPVEPAAKDS